MPRIPVKNLSYERSGFSRQLKSLLLISMLPLLAISIRLGYLQVIHYQYFATMSEKNLLSIVPLQPERGLIYDRHGRLLATNYTSYKLDIIPERAQHLSQSIQRLQPILQLKEQDIQGFYQRLRQYRPYQAVTLDYNLTQTQIARIYNDQYLLPGVLISPSQHRSYPLGKITAPIIGYVGRINANELHHLSNDNYHSSNFIGKIGIEKYYDHILQGTVGAKEIETDVNGYTVKTLQTVPAYAGSNLRLSIDADLQRVAMHAIGKQHGAAVAIDPQNGEVLALASQPTYDPNQLTQGMSEQTYKQLFDSEHATLFNKATRGMYSVASTIKPFLAVGALGMGLLHANDAIYDPGWFQIPNTKHVYHDWKLTGHGWVNVSRAIMLSCDTFFYNLGLKLGIKRIGNILTSFGFGQVTGIDMPGEKAGLVPSPAWKETKFAQPWYKGDSVETAIGQEYMLATPLQLATAAAVLANHGHPVQPHLLLSASTANPKNSVAQPPATQTTKESSLLEHIRPANWHVVEQAMQQVILNPHGTGLHFGRHPSYTVAAKTGTEQVFGHQRNEESTQANLPAKLRNNHLFIAYAPVNKPCIAIAVVIEHQAEAAEIARKLLDYYLITEQQCNNTTKKLAIMLHHPGDHTDAK